MVKAELVTGVPYVLSVDPTQRQLPAGGTVGFRSRIAAPAAGEREVRFAGGGELISAR